MFTEQQIKEIRNKGLYEFLCNNAHNFSKYAITDIFKEFIYAVYVIDKEIERKAVEDMLEEFIENSMD